VKKGDLVWLNIVGKKKMGIVCEMDPTFPDEERREWTDEDYYWIIVPITGEKKWVKGNQLELIAEIEG
jgi:hypothetical protein